MNDVILMFMCLSAYAFPGGRKHLESITSVGPRPVGSVENEVMTVGYLLAEIEKIKEESMAGPHAITVDVQQPTGSFSIDFLGGFTSYYDKVTNIAVKLEPKSGAQHLMLANCHFDSVANSPGTVPVSTICSSNWNVLSCHHSCIKHFYSFCKLKCASC